MIIYNATTLKELLPNEDDQYTFDSVFGGLCWGRMYNARKKDLIRVLDDLDPNEDDYKEQVPFAKMVIDKMSYNNIEIIIDIESLI